jgi:hypothetical protein
MLPRDLEPGMIVVGLAPGHDVAELVTGRPTEVRDRGGYSTWTSGYVVPVQSGPPITAHPDHELHLVDHIDVKEVVQAAESAPWLALDGVVPL